MNKGKCLNNAFNTLNDFGKISGLKINVDKSEILLLGSSTIWDIPQEYRNIIKDTVNILGIKVCKNRKEMMRSNYNPIRDRIEDTIKCWSKRKLSLAGKICVIKTMILSKLIYCMTVLPSPSTQYWNDINKMLFKFIANMGSEKLKRNTLIGDYKEGGFWMTDIECQNKALKCSWMKRLINNSGMWREFVIEQIPHGDYRYFLRCNLKFEDLPWQNQHGSIWEKIWKEWCKINFTKRITTI